MLLNGDIIDALSFIIHRDKAMARARRIAERLKEHIPRQMFEIPVQIAIGSKSGEIYSENEDIQKDLNETLNLNSEGHRLPQNRKEKLNAVINEIAKTIPQGTWTKEKIRNLMIEYGKCNSEGKKTEYLGIIQWYLGKKMK